MFWLNKFIKLLYENIGEHNPNKKCKILTVFDYMTADMLSNKNLIEWKNELFITGRKLASHSLILQKILD